MGGVRVKSFEGKVRITSEQEERYEYFADLGDDMLGLLDMLREMGYRPYRGGRRATLKVTIEVLDAGDDFTD